MTDERSPTVGKKQRKPPTSARQRTTPDGNALAAELIRNGLAGRHILDSGWKPPLEKDAAQ